MSGVAGMSGAVGMSGAAQGYRDMMRGTAPAGCTAKEMTW